MGVKNWFYNQWCSRIQSPSKNVKNNLVNTELIVNNQNVNNQNVNIMLTKKS